MYKILGSLLLVSLLSKPVIFRVDYITYEFYKAQDQLIAIVRRIGENENEKTDFELALDINDTMSDINTNIHNISRLLKDKNNMLGKVQTAMELKAYSKSAMSEDQIALFQKFYESYAKKNEIVTNTLNEIDEQLALSKAKKEILISDTNYKTILNELKALNDRQYDAIFTLNDMIEMGEKVLEEI